MYVSVLEKQAYRLQSSVEAAGDGGIVTVFVFVLVFVFVFVFVFLYMYVFVSEKQVYQKQSSVEATRDEGFVTIYIFTCICVYKYFCIQMCIRVLISVRIYVSVLEREMYQIHSSVEATGDGGIVTVLGGSIHHPYATPIPHTSMHFPIANETNCRILKEIISASHFPNSSHRAGFPLP